MPRMLAFIGLLPSRWPDRNSGNFTRQSKIDGPLAFRRIILLFWPLRNQYCGQNLGCLIGNDAIVTKRFVIRAGFFQTLPVGEVLTKSAEKPRHSCRGGIGVGRAGLNAQEPNKTHAVPEPSMGEGTAEREAPAFMPGRTSLKSSGSMTCPLRWLSVLCMPLTYASIDTFR